MQKTKVDKKLRGDGHTDVGTDLYFHGVDTVFAPRPGQDYNMRDPRQVAERLARRARREQERGR
jgi:hypothetical protein